MYVGFLFNKNNKNQNKYTNKKFFYIILKKRKPKKLIKFQQNEGNPKLIESKNFNFK